MSGSFDVPDPADFEARRARVRDTHRCPHCDEAFVEVDLTGHPFNQWDANVVHICLNDDCPYFVRGRETMADQGMEGASYRLLYVPDRDWMGPVPDSVSGLFHRRPRA